MFDILSVYATQSYLQIQHNPYWNPNVILCGNWKKKVLKDIQKNKVGLLTYTIQKNKNKNKNKTLNID